MRGADLLALLSLQGHRKPGARGVRATHLQVPSDFEPVLLSGFPVEGLAVSVLRDEEPVPSALRRAYFRSEPARGTAAGIHDDRVHPIEQATATADVYFRDRSLRGGGGTEQYKALDPIESEYDPERQSHRIGDLREIRFRARAGVRRAAEMPRVQRDEGIHEQADPGNAGDQSAPLADAKALAAVVPDLREVPRPLEPMRVHLEFDPR